MQSRAGTCGRRSGAAGAPVRSHESAAMMVSAEHGSKQKQSLSESPSVFITINRSLSLTLSQQCSSSWTHMGSVSQQTMQRGCYDEATKHHMLSAFRIKTRSADNRDSCSYHTEGVTRLFFSSPSSFFLYCRQYDEAPGHTKVGTEVIVVETYLLETVQSISFMTAVKAEQRGPDQLRWQDPDPNLDV